MKKEVCRMCVLSHEVKDQKSLIRFTLVNGKPVIDITGKAAGRGYYVSKDKTLIEEAKKKNSLKRILKVEVDSSFYDELLNQVKEG